MAAHRHARYSALMARIHRAETAPGTIRPEELQDAAAYPHPVGAVELLQTNTSVIALTGRYAYKIKKPVTLEFLDMSTLERRRFLCEEELRLNARLAPDLYLEVVPIVRNATGIRVGGAGEAVEYAVRMRQFDRAQELATLLERGAVGWEEIAALGERVARFHLDAAPAAGERTDAATGRMRDATLGNLATLLAHMDAGLDIAELGALIDWTHDFLRRRFDGFRARAASGFIRECHGDLHARNITRWQGRLTPFDCLEFDPGLRWIDVMNDAAFLVMDLCAHSREDLAAVFLDRYLGTTGDYAGVPLLPFYAATRALVRAMVDALAAEADSRGAPQYGARFEARVRTAARFMHPKPPLLIAMHGPSGSGKSWLSERLVPAAGAIRIRSDVERKRLATAATHTSRENDRTYSRLRECADSCLQGGLTTIIDAACLQRAERDLFHAFAARAGVPLLWVSCTAPQPVLVERIDRRRQTTADPSDADRAVLETQLKSMEPLGDDERRDAVEIDTGDPGAVDQTLAAIVRRRTGQNTRPSPMSR